MCPLISPASGAASSFILALMSEWPVFHITGRAPASASAAGSTLRTLHVEDHRGPGPEAPDRVAAEHDQELVAADDLAGFVHRADPVAVAVERDAQLGAGARRTAAWRSPQVLGDGGIGMMIGEGAVRLAEERP